MTLWLIEICHTCIIVVILPCLSIIMILVDQTSGIVDTSKCPVGERCTPLVISFPLRLIRIHLTIGSFSMVHPHHQCRHHHKIVTGVLLGEVAFGHPGVVPHQAGWIGDEEDIMMAPHVGEEELYRAPLRLIGTSQWTLWIMVSKFINIYFMYFQLTLFFTNLGPLPPHHLPPSHGPPPPPGMLAGHGAPPPNIPPNKAGDPTNVSALLNKLVDAGLIGGESSGAPPQSTAGPGIVTPLSGASGVRATPLPLLRQTPPPPISIPHLSFTPATLKQWVYLWYI